PRSPGVDFRSATVATHEQKRRPAILGLLAAAAVGLALCAAAASAPAGERDPNAPPHDDFSGAVGEFKVSMTAAPPQVPVEQPVTLRGRVAVLPEDREELERKKLKIVPPTGAKLEKTLFPKRTRENFHIRYLPAEDSRSADPLSWTFVFELRPKSTQVTQ